MRALRNIFASEGFYLQQDKVKDLSRLLITKMLMLRLFLVLFVYILMFETRT